MLWRRSHGYEVRVSSLGSLSLQIIFYSAHYIIEPRNISQLGMLSLARISLAMNAVKASLENA